MISRIKSALCVSAFFALSAFTYSAQQVINIGANPNDGTGDTLRSAFTKANSNFTDLYTQIGALTPLTAGTNVTISGGAINVPSFPWSAITGENEGVRSRK